MTDRERVHILLKAILKINNRHDTTDGARKIAIEALDKVTREKPS